jgi:hypothetical protein
VGDVAVADYVSEPVVEPTRGPRPYLHPVRTLGGTVVTDILPEDHPHHLGVSVAMQDVNGTNLWGGRTYVRNAGYTWREDHGRVEHVEWVNREDGRLVARLHWLDREGRTLLEEERTMAAVGLAGDAWVLEIGYRLVNPTEATMTLGSPATNGRPGKAGYGGFFWRLAPGVPYVFDPATDTEEDVNGSAADWVAAVGANPDLFTLIFTGLGEGDRWFVRATEYPGVCVALAFEAVRRIEPGGALERRHRVIVADGTRTRDEVPALVAALP